jgi:hypothetical protein
MEEEQALMAKYGVRTIEEARRKEAEEQALMAKHGVNTIEEARRKEVEEQARREAEFRALVAELMAEHGATHGM